MFIFGLIQQGPRGIEHLISRGDEDVVDIQNYGIDWEAQRNPLLMNHLRHNNPEDYDDTNPFSTFASPETMAEVICDSPGCMLSPPQLQVLDNMLLARPDRFSKDMHVWALIWRDSLALCRTFYQTV